MFNHTEQSNPSTTTDKNPKAFITFHADTEEKVIYSLAIANTPESREKGLMYIASLKDNEGMLFIFPINAQHVFWMKNTPLSLDIIHLDEEMTIVGMLKQTVPLSEAPLWIKKFSRYVIELKAGSSKKLHLQEGDKLSVQLPKNLSVN